MRLSCLIIFLYWNEYCGKVKIEKNIARDREEMLRETEKVTLLLQYTSDNKQELDQTLHVFLKENDRW